MGGLFGILLLPLIVILLLGGILLASISGLVNGLSVAAQGGLVNYDESAFEEYADTCYAQEFPGTAYEDNILIVLVTAENCEDFKWIGWVGNHLTADVNQLFGGNETELGRAFTSNMSPNYQYALTNSLTAVVEQMEEQVVLAVGDGEAFRSTCQDKRGNYESHVTNKTELRIDEETLNAALAQFTATTDIPIVIVVDTAENVFGRYIPASSIVAIVVTVLLLGLVIFLTVRMVRRRKQQADSNDYGSNNGNPDNGSYNNGYGGGFY